MRKYKYHSMLYDINFFKVSPQNIKPKQGMALIAEPGLNDPYFKRSIVLLMEHSEEGTMGFVLNKHLDINVSEIVEDFPPSNSSLLMLGGPVESDSLYYIHTLGNLIPNSRHICNSIYWGGDFDTLKELIQLNRIKDNEVKFFLGHAGWSEGQLLDEIKKESWVLTCLSDAEIMDNGNNLWKKTVMRLGDKYRMWMNYPEDPHLN